jgi:hypothetical protein
LPVKPLIFLRAFLGFILTSSSNLASAAAERFQHPKGCSSRQAAGQAHRDAINGIGYRLTSIRLVAARFMPFA